MPRYELNTSIKGMCDSERTRLFSFMDRAAVKGLTGAQMGLYVSMKGHKAKRRQMLEIFLNTKDHDISKALNVYIEEDIEQIHESSESQKKIWVSRMDWERRFPTATVDRMIAEKIKGKEGVDWKWHECAPNDEGARMYRDMIDEADDKHGTIERSATRFRGKLDSHSNGKESGFEMLMDVLDRSRFEHSRRNDNGAPHGAATKPRKEPRARAAGGSHSRRKPKTVDDQAGDWINNLLERKRFILKLSAGLKVVRHSESMQAALTEISDKLHTYQQNIAELLGRDHDENDVLTMVNESKTYLDSTEVKYDLSAAADMVPTAPKKRKTERDTVKPEM